MRSSVVQQVARYEGIMNRVSRLNHSCNKLHATRESWITYRGWFIRASRCTLRGNRGLRTAVNSFVHQDARYEGIVNHVSRLIRSCNKLHATRESWIAYRGWIIRATSCTLRGNRESRIGVESFVQQVARYEGIVNYVSGLIHSCIKMHATRESWMTYYG